MEATAQNAAAANASSLGARLAANERERFEMIDDAILGFMRERASDGASLVEQACLSTDVARALEAQGATLRHVEVVDGLCRLVRRDVVRTRNGFYYLHQAAEARA